MTVKMPEPMTAPMPRAVSDQGPRVFLSACSGSSDSRMSLSMDLRASSWLGRAVLLGQRVLVSGLEAGPPMPEQLCRSVQDWPGMLGARVGEPEREFGGKNGAGRPRGPARGSAVWEPGALALADAAHQLLQLFLVGAARSGALGLGGGLFAGRALHFFPLLAVFNLGCICHCYPLSLECVQPRPGRRDGMNLYPTVYWELT